MRRNLLYYFLTFKLEFMGQLAFKENFWTWSIVHTLALLTSVLFFRIIYTQVVQINGWNLSQTLLVLGVGNLLAGLGSMTFFSLMYGFSKDVANGDFDYKLTKPVDPLIQAAFSEPDVEDFMVVPTSIILIGYVVLILSPQNIGINILGFLVLLACSLLIMFSLLVFMESFAFKFVRLNAARNFYWSLVDITKYPAKSVKNVSRLAIIMLAPIALISSVPAEVLFGRWEWNWIISSIAVSLVLVFLSRKFFMHSLKQYSSASS